MGKNPEWWDGNEEEGGSCVRDSVKKNGKEGGE